MWAQQTAASPGTAVSSGYRTDFCTVLLPVQVADTGAQPSMRLEKLAAASAQLPRDANLRLEVCAAFVPGATTWVLYYGTGFDRLLC